ncbi:FecR family protein [Pedobacter westerhofensis]|uniref:FecR family protein n=1 Tax=Pedobacter westerhofensis TaxID=425512 RepID=A0A521BPB4_9SPHI|nr:FecR family protein [Pedobacter westerhofensis]SMO49008.1 FecR family protein [Pedobacter westerhofensis]
MNTDTRIQFLFSRYVSGEATPDETVEFFLLLNDAKYKAVFHQLMDQYLIETTFSNGLNEEQKTGILQEIFKAPEPVTAAAETSVPLPLPGAVQSFPLWRKMLGAAIVLITLSAAVFFISRPKRETPITYTEYKGELKPGGNKATLTLNDGTKLCLSDAANGKLAQQGNVRIRKSAEGRIIYEITAPENKVQTNAENEPQYNIVSTPAGGQYQVLLPDGTRVWLNAASSLKYPVSFAALKERRVELSGEAYFEVAKINRGRGRLPFLVKSSGQEVEVLGTHFNINTYKEEKAAVTTLLEGSVRVSRAGAFAAVIAPGEQAIVNEGIKISRADTSTAVAWKNGIFKFDHADIYTVMNQLSRWYDLDVEYRGKAPENKFNGEVYRNMDASKAFRILSLARINFRLETPLNHQGRKKIVITQQQKMP